MAEQDERDLSINYHEFTLKEIRKSKEINFQEAFSVMNRGKESATPLLDIIQRLYSFYDGKFEINKSSKYVVTLSDLDYDEERSIIYGYAKIGETGYNRPYFDVNNAMAPSGQIGEDETLPQHHFFILYFPLDLHFGFIGFQNFRSDKKWGFFKESIKNFFKENNLSIFSQPNVPEKVRQEFSAKSNVKEIILFSDKATNNARDKLKKASQMVPKDKSFDVEIRIKGFTEESDDFFRRLDKELGWGKSKISSKEVGFLEEDMDFELSFMLEKPGGGSKKADINTRGQINPTIYLPNSLLHKEKYMVKLPDAAEHCYNHIRQMLNEVITRMRR